MIEVHPPYWGLRSLKMVWDVIRVKLSLPCGVIIRGVKFSQPVYDRSGQSVVANHNGQSRAGHCGDDNGIIRSTERYSNYSVDSWLNIQ
jgi:hypothetical protein